MLDGRIEIISGPEPGIANAVLDRLARLLRPGAFEG